VEGYNPDNEFREYYSDAQHALRSYVDPSWLPWILSVFPDYKPPPTFAERAALKATAAAQLATGDISLDEYMNIMADISTPEAAESQSSVALSAADGTDAVDASSETTPVKKGKGKGKGKVAAVDAPPREPRSLPKGAVLVRFLFLFCLFSSFAAN
jgi:hypothetical protein